ncbi:hypothetical protein S7711_02946 [Stachybotrys chartarum IBT 7711]|uniref:Maltose/galactoside acetyltransferase domain-containing protein n=1 Tax=Stachybotrys chartarum (strain CBS 109288 / IBT 7711) TaxID=1280523 RepID=A0A084B2D9_STACB|nr:hypothetical protein S7711_02946 [Stachybotrys chartarum IBT 7711]
MASTEKDPAIIAHAKTLENTPWCDDYEKMISGVLYDSMAPELVNGRFRARRLMNKYNTHFPDDATVESLFVERTDLLKQILVILDCGMVTIGNRVMFGPFVSIFAATHETGVQSRRDGVEYARGVVIGDDCWIGGNTTIMPGVTIGKGCTIGAGSIVTKDVPDFSVAIGSPARVVKKVDAVPDL